MTQRVELARVGNRIFPVRVALGVVDLGRTTDAGAVFADNVNFALIAAAERLFAELPADLGASLHDWWREFEAGETPEAALIRELEEELGIQTKTACLAPLSFASHSYENFHLLMPLYVCRKWQGIPQAKEHIALKWVRPQALRDYPMPPADEPLIAALCDLL